MGKVRELLARTSGARASIPHTCPRPSRPLATTDGMNTCGRVAEEQTEGVIDIMVHPSSFVHQQYNQAVSLHWAWYTKLEQAKFSWVFVHAELQISLPCEAKTPALTDAEPMSTMRVSLSSAGLVGMGQGWTYWLAKSSTVCVSSARRHRSASCRVLQRTTT